MLPEMRIVEGEILPYLKETANHTENAAEAQLSLWAGEAEKPLLLLTSASPWDKVLPEYDLREIHFDAEKMLISQLRGALGARFAMSAAVPSVRSNMGCGTYNTLFGLEQMIFPDKMPWIKTHLAKDTLAAMGPEDIDISRSKEFMEALHQMKFMKEMLRGTGVSIYPIDLQGPVDVAHLALGDQFFYELYDDEDFVHHLMDLSAAAIIKGTRVVLDIIGREDGFIAHYNGLAMPLAAPLKISEDTSTLLSGAHIDGFALPYSKKVLRQFGGGYMHFCGVNAHLLEAAIHSADFSGLNLGNPEKHDMADIIARLGGVGKVYYGHAPRLEGEGREDWFSRLIDASISGDVHARLLFAMHCEPGDIENVKNDWLSAGGAIPGDFQ